MRQEPTFDERILNSALLLSVYWLCEEKAGRVGDRLKAMKLGFLCARPLFERRYKGFDLTFYKWRWGPMSNQVYQCWSDLATADYLLEEEEFFLAPAGKRLAREFVEEVLSDESNSAYLRQIRTVVEEFAPLSTGQVLDYVHELEVVPVRWRRAVKVAECPDATRLTEILDRSEAERSLSIDKGWRETLALLFNPRALSDIARGRSDFRGGRFSVGLPV